MQTAQHLRPANASFCACRYFSDVWTYDTQALKWECRHTGASSAPTPRGGGQVAVHGDVLYAFGGHSVWVEDKREREKVHDEVWALDLLKWQV